MSGTFTIPEIRCNRHFYGAILCANQAQAPINEGIVAIEPCAECISNAVETLTAQVAALRDALMSIAWHDAEFSSIEDAELMVVRMAEKARAALAIVDGAR